ncbi:unnamed protein product [Sphenostylis stenocarpa]|uniref:Uncharacterized protein n=1 Tax=Sphenostylis stenocarpa TaxID=92480 RepID=A0AA86VEG9_9FABA|nr:unnamed protein product [Sphenostylis stenocarpa]
MALELAQYLTYKFLRAVIIHIFEKFILFPRELDQYYADKYLRTMAIILKKDPDIATDIEGAGAMLYGV